MKFYGRERQILGRHGGLPCYRPGFFSGSGFCCAERKDVILTELKELYG